MASWSAAADAEAAAAVQATTRRRAAASRRPVNPLRNGVTTIVVVALLLAGLVAVNVGVLGLNVRLDRLSRERAELRDQNAALASRLSSAKASPLIEARARTRLGLVPPGPDKITYVELGH
jgi:cell division protein FtsB